MNPQSMRVIDGRVTVAIFGLAVVAVLIPVFLVRIPTLLDYPNHLVRLWILAGRAEGTPVASMYQADWSLARTNIGIDVLGSILGRLLPIEIAGKALIGLALTLPPLGMVMLNRSIFGGWHWWMVGFFLFAWNFVVVGGLLSFQVALALALFAASTEPLLARRPTVATALVRIAFGAVIMTAHVFGLLFYLSLLIGLLFGPDLTAFRAAPAFKRFVIRSLQAGFACIVPLVLLLSFASRLPGAHVASPTGAPVYSVPGGVTFPPLELLERLSITLTPLKTYALVPDLMTLAALAVLPIYALFRRRLTMHAGLFGMSVVLFVLSQFMPNDAFGTGFIDTRLPAMAGLMMAASVRPNLNGSARLQHVFAMLMLAVVIARAAWIWSVWSERQGDVQAIAAAAEGIAPGSSVLVARHFTGDVSDPRLPPGRHAHGQAIYIHMPTLVTIWRAAFVPNIFTSAGKQPLRVRPAWADKAIPEGSVPMVDELDRQEPRRYYPYLRDWRRQFDYVLLVNADMPNRGPGAESVPGLHLMADAGFARLYRIERAP